MEHGSPLLVVLRSVWRTQSDLPRTIAMGECNQWVCPVTDRDVPHLHLLRWVVDAGPEAAAVFGDQNVVDAVIDGVVVQAHRATSGDRSCVTGLRVCSVQVHPHRPRAMPN